MFVQHLILEAYERRYSFQEIDAVTLTLRCM